MLTLVKRTRPGKIGRQLYMEKSTVSRNFERMRNNGWIAMEPGDSAPAES
jgi:DNA-binding MarR family transcriptional regulator